MGKIKKQAEVEDVYDLKKALSQISKPHNAKPKRNCSEPTPLNNVSPIINNNYYYTNEDSNKKSTGESENNNEFTKMQMCYIKSEVNEDLQGKFDTIDARIKEKINKSPFWWTVGICVTVILAVFGFLIAHNYRLGDKIEKANDSYYKIESKVSVIENQKISK